MPLLGGVRPPVAALLCTLLAVAALTALVLGPSSAQVVAPAVSKSQQHIAGDYAASVRSAVDDDAAALRRAAAQLAASAPADSGDALRQLATLGHRWRGAAVVDPANGKVLAVTGEGLPDKAAADVKTGPAIKPRMVTTAGGESRLLVFAELDIAGAVRMLAASDAIALPSPGDDPGRTILLVDRKGRTVAAAGASIKDRKLPASAATQASRAGGNPSQAASGVLFGSAQAGSRVVAGWTELASTGQSQAASALGLTLITTITTPETRSTTGDALFALLASAGLLVATLLVTLILVPGLQRPLLRLHLSGARLARGDLARPVQPAKVGELARISHALEALRQQLLGADPAEFRPLRTRFDAGVLVLCCGLLLLAWSTPLLLLGNHPDPGVTLPQQLVSDQELRTTDAAALIRTQLDDGYAEVAGVAGALTAAGTADDARKLLKGALDQPKRFRSIYVLAKDGSVLARTGSKPDQQLSSPRQGNGVVQLNNSGRVPVVVAYAAVSDPAPGAAARPADHGGSAPASVVAEFDAKELSDPLGRAGLGSVWLIDTQRKVIAANSGYRAFQDLPDPALSRLAGTAQKAAGSVVQTSGSGSMAAAAPLTATGGPSLPHWWVVSSQDGSRLDLDAYRTQRLILFAALLGMAAATGCLGWLYVVVVRPLRQLALTAERLAGGDRRTVLYPVNHDEVGSVTRSLELLRQWLTAHYAGRTPSSRA